MLTVSNEANPNYLCKVVKLEGLKKHPNADRLQTIDIDFQTVITGMDAKDGDIYVYFPVESKINSEFLSHTNSFRKNLNLNKDLNAEGFFEENCRVRAMRLRGEKSCGYIVPANVVYDYLNVLYDPVGDVGAEFDTINEFKLVEKYIVKSKEQGMAKQGKKPKVSRIIEGQVHLHVDTENLRRNADKISPEDIISITYKTHGTSWWVSNVLVKRKLSWFERILIKFGVSVQDTEYALVYGSRKTVKNSGFDDPKGKDHFYGYDLWEGIKDEVGSFIPKGFTLYGEMLGYDKNGGMIQKDFDYGCKQGEHKLEIYRITNTTPDGLVTELSYPEIAEFCEKSGLKASELEFYGKAKDVNFRKAGLLDYVDESWPGYFIKCLEEDYNEKDCRMCNNKVPEEGVVVRKESLFDFEAYKLKSFRFLEKESVELDKGVSNIESEN